MPLTKAPQGYQVTTADSGNTLQIGDAGHGSVTGGGILLEFVPNTTGPAFVGSFTVVGRVGGGALQKQEAALGVPYAQIPYRQLYLNGAVADYSIVSTTITGASIILIPAAGLSIGLLVGTITQGGGTLYFRTLEGATAP